MNKTWLTPTMVLVHIGEIDAPEFRFRSGQFVSVKVGNPAFRSYSICSGNQYTTGFDLLIDVRNPGIGADFFKNSREGDTIEFVGPAGKFYLMTSDKDSIIFVATGAGIAPFKSMLEELARYNFTGKVTVYLGVRTVGDVLFMDFFEYLRQNLAQFELVVCFSQEQRPPFGRYGRVTAHFDYTLAKESQIYICGNPNMIEEMSHNIEKLGIPLEQVHTEKFTVRSKKGQ